MIFTCSPSASIEFFLSLGVWIDVKNDLWVTVNKGIFRWFNDFLLIVWGWVTIWSTSQSRQNSAKCVLMIPISTRDRGLTGQALELFGFLIFLGNKWPDQTRVHKSKVVQLYRVLVQYLRPEYQSRYSVLLKKVVKLSSQENIGTSPLGIEVYPPNNIKSWLKSMQIDLSHWINVLEWYQLTC